MPSSFIRCLVAIAGLRDRLAEALQSEEVGHVMEAVDILFAPLVALGHLPQHALPIGDDLSRRILRHHQATHLGMDDRVPELGEGRHVG